MGKCLICRPQLRSTDGGDHTGRDFFLRCLKCGTRTTHHVEANYPGEAEPMLRKEWRRGRITPKAMSDHENRWQDLCVGCLFNALALLS